MNQVKQDFDQLLEKEMDRLTFIKHIGIGFGAIIGVSTIIKSMNSLGAGTPESTAKLSGQGYGTSAYGGTTVNKAL